MSRLAFLVLFFGVLTGCFSSGGGSDSSSSSINVSGKAEKGPFEAAATLKIQKLNQSGGFTQTAEFPMSDVGKYSAQVRWEGWSVIEVSGDTISEIDINVLQPATLTALANLNPNAATTNTNLFTHLHAQRVLELVRGGADVRAGATQALAELNEAFYLSLTGLSDLADLSLSASADSADRDDGALFVLSAALSVRNQVSGDITLLTSDFADDGQFNGAGDNLLVELRSIAEDLDLQVPMENIRNIMGQVVGYEALGNVLPKWVTGEIQIAAEVVSQEDSVFDIDLYDASTGDLVLSGPDADQVKVGSIVSGYDEQTAPSGFLRRVLAVDTVNGQRVAVTEPAHLGEAITEGALRIRFGVGRALESGDRSLTTATTSQAAVSAYSTSGFLNYRTIQSPFPYRKTYSGGFKPHVASMSSSILSPENWESAAEPSEEFLSDYGELTTCVISGLSLAEHTAEFGKACKIRTNSEPSQGNRVGVNWNWDLEKLWEFNGNGSAKLTANARAGAIFGASFAADFDFNVFSANTGRIRTVLDTHAETSGHAALTANYAREDSFACDGRKEGEVYKQIGRKLVIPPINIVLDFGWQCSLDVAMESKIDGVLGIQLSNRYKREFVLDFHQSNGVSTSSAVLSDKGFVPTFIRDAQMSGKVSTRLGLKVGARLYDSFGILVGPYGEVEGGMKTASLDQYLSFSSDYDASTSSDVLGHYVNVATGGTGSVFFQSDIWRAFADRFGLASVAGEAELTFEADSFLIRKTPPVIFGASRVDTIGAATALTVDWGEPVYPDNGSYDPVYEVRIGTSPETAAQGHLRAEVTTKKSSISLFQNSSGETVNLDPRQTYYLCLMAFFDDSKDVSESFGCTDELTLPADEGLYFVYETFTDGLGSNWSSPTAYAASWTELLPGVRYNPIRIGRPDQANDHRNLMFSKPLDMTRNFVASMVVETPFPNGAGIVISPNSDAISSGIRCHFSYLGGATPGTHSGLGGYRLIDGTLWGYSNPTSTSKYDLTSPTRPAVVRLTKVGEQLSCSVNGSSALVATLDQLTDESKTFPSQAYVGIQVLDPDNMDLSHYLDVELFSVGYTD